MAVGSEAGCSALKQQVRGICNAADDRTKRLLCKETNDCQTLQSKRISCAVPCRPLAGDPSRQQVLQLLSLKQCDRLRVVGVV